jgi:hypothetical protein
VADPELSWAFLLLSALEAADSGPANWEIPTDAFSTVLRRLQPFSNCVAYRRLAQIVNAKIK